MKGIKSFGFTLIELMLVVVIITILASVLYPLLCQYQISAKRARCIANMLQIYNAVESRRSAMNPAPPETTWGAAYVNSEGKGYFLTTPYCPENTAETYNISTAADAAWRPACKMTQDPYCHYIETN